MECLAHKNGKKVRYSGKREYFCVVDVVEVLGLKKRHSFKGKEIKKVKTKNRKGDTKNMIYLHHTHMEWLIRKSTRPEKVRWLLKECCGIDSSTSTGTATRNTLPATPATGNVILDLWDNYMSDYKRKMLKRDMVLWPEVTRLCPSLQTPERFDFPSPAYESPSGSLYVQRRIPDRRLWLCLPDVEHLFEIHLHNKESLGIRKHAYDRRRTQGEGYERVTHEFIPAHHFATVYSQKRKTNEDAYRAIMRLLAGLPCKNCGQIIKTCD